MAGFSSLLWLSSFAAIADILTWCVGVAHVA